MATRVVPTPTDADNPAGSFTLAACNDWRFGVRRFHVGTGHYESTHDAGYTTAGLPFSPPLSISLLLPRGSPYTWLGRNTGALVKNKLPTAIAMRPDGTAQRFNDCAGS